MSLTKASLVGIVKKQYFYKLKAYIQIFMNLIVLQLLAILISFNGIGGGGTSADSIEVSYKNYSTDFVVAFTLLWGFIAAIQITTKAYRNDDFTFVTNRLTSNLSNALFLLTASMIGGITAILSSYFIKVIVYFLASDFMIKSNRILADPSEFLVGITSTFLYVFLFCSVGYFVGTLIQRNKIFAVLLPVLFFGLLFLGGIDGNGNRVVDAFGFIFTESSINMFIMKAVVAIGLLFSCSFVLDNRMEVKQ